MCPNLNKCHRRFDNRQQNRVEMIMFEFKCDTSLGTRKHYSSASDRTNANWFLCLSMPEKNCLVIIHVKRYPSIHIIVVYEKTLLWKASHILQDREMDKLHAASSWKISNIRIIWGVAIWKNYGHPSFYYASFHEECFLSEIPRIFLLFFRVFFFPPPPQGF